MRASPLALAVLAATALGLVPPARAQPCLEGSSAATDTADVARVRQRIEAVCPCAAFDGSTTTLARRAYRDCVRGVVRDASDGTPILGLFGMRRECARTVIRIHRQSTCGYTPGTDHHPCCRHTIGSGRNRGSIRAAARCLSTPGEIRNLCLGAEFVADACSGDAVNSCNPACGDGTRNGAEECDAGDDATCPGLCGSDCRCPQVEGTTHVIPSAAHPAETPGSAGVTVTNPKLLAQFGAGAFSLNNAIYVRFRMNRPAGTPDAILILVPGFEGGANDFKILAENLIPRALADHGQVLEVWAIDRRTNQLEDLAGLDVAEAFLAPEIGLDWLFGGELGLALHPALVAGPNRRAEFYDAHADVPFLANWTSLVFSHDIDAVVTTADAVVRNHNVFLGGHSAGTGFTARYAATDFNLTGIGAPVPGYAKLRGLALFEGGGASSGGASLTPDTLDRIEAKFDGGLFGAVRDDAARCVDGTTPCTIATEVVDCAGKVPPKCTPPTTAYAIVAGLLNPRIFAASEPVAIQGMTDPNGGRQILGVDQGAPGNNALAQVPDLASLNFLPPGTAMASIGGFVDDDGVVAAAASFVATSVGAPGPVVDGLTTWLDITQPQPPAVLPNNGAPPTSLPPSRWGQEKEVTRFELFFTTFFAGGSNFTDWYYPSAGLSATSVSGVCTAGTCTVGNVGASCSTNANCNQAIGLDSTALSVGRGRRDIENLTQGANINIPVIGFGGTNGLTPAPGSYVAFAQSIGVCTAPSCTGAPRVVDALNPNPAFPTLGGVAGGFEVHLSEGYAHVDVLTAEDAPHNNVLAPLAAFLARNAQ